jgi:hypothetical protein
VRMHFPHYVKQLEGHMWRDAQRGLAHSYSRAKVKFNVNRADNMIIQVREQMGARGMQSAESAGRGAGSFNLSSLRWLP